MANKMVNNKCKTPMFCKNQREDWLNKQNVAIPFGEREHELFIEQVDKGDYEITRTNYTKFRQFERVINENDISDVTYHGWVIERTFSFESQLNRVVIMGYTRNQRPLHLVYEIEAKNRWKLITAYSPTSKRYKWNESYTQRVCFCK